MSTDYQSDLENTTVPGAQSGPFRPFRPVWGPDNTVWPHGHSDTMHPSKEGESNGDS